MDAPSLTFEALPRHAMHVLPHQVIFASLLGLSGAELHDAIERELAQNPALVRDTPDPPTVPLPPASSRPATAPGDPPAAQEPPTAALLSDAAASLPGDDRWLAAYLLADLDERGLLGRSVEAIAVQLRPPAGMPPRPHQIRRPQRSSGRLSLRRPAIMLRDCFR
jgi:DNA-directed RNA polymerase specialized sigma54-like protein